MKFIPKYFPNPLQKLDWKWQLLPTDPENGVLYIKHYRLLKFFGARLFIRAEIAALEFRFAYLGFRYSDSAIHLSRGIMIPIPFMKDDFIFALMRRRGTKRS